MHTNKLAHAVVFISILGFGACTSDESISPSGTGGGQGGGGGGQDGGGGDSGVDEGVFGFRDCGTTSPRIGQVAELEGRNNYTVSGTVEIIDDCTLRFSDLVSNSLGIRLYAYGGQSINNFDGVGSGFFFGPEIFSVDDQTVIATQGPIDLANDGIRGAGPQLDPFADGNTDFLVQMKPGRELDVLGAMSIWCEPATQNFGEGIFAAAAR